MNEGKRTLRKEPDYGVFGCKRRQRGQLRRDYRNSKKKENEWLISTSGRREEGDISKRPIRL